jgi:putative ABC transport system ATP-binding protein
MPIIRVDNVSKTYRLGEQDVTALSDVSLIVDPGVFMAIAGPSGSGKSTLLNIMGCIDTAMW